MSRNFGMSGPASSHGGGASADRSTYGAYSTRADPYPLPAGSIYRDGFSPVVDPRTKERAALSFATVFWSLVFAIPLALVGIMLRFH